jgi:pilus assembly protein CpaF
MIVKHQNVSINEIREQYFGKISEAKNKISNIDANANQNLTPSAKYILREARKRLGEHSALKENVMPDESDLLRLVSHVEHNEGEELSDKERTSVVATLSASLDHYDILTPLIENQDINDIIIRSFNDVTVQVGRKNLKTDIRFTDHETYKSFVENLLKRAGKACTAATPVVDAAIDPHIRACVTHESFSPKGSGPMMTLRISRHRHVSLEALAQYEFAPQTVLEYLSTLMEHTDATILIAGEVGTGKTTLVKALAHRIPPEEAILVIEDTHEIDLHRQFVRTLLTREANTEGAGRISPAQAIRAGMRMAMNRVILGEMRDAEAAESFIDVCASGHPGTSTIHAKSARDAVARLELFLARAQGNVTIDTIRRQIANAVSVIVFLDVDRNEQKRRVMEVLEVDSASDGFIQLSPIFRYNAQSSIPEWTRESGVTKFQDILKKSGFIMPEKGSKLRLDPEHMYLAYCQTNIASN